MRRLFFGLTAAEREALDFLDTLTNEPGLNLQMTMVPGDMQFLHNHQILHSRTDFEDGPEPARKRHLLRLWIAPHGGRPLPPSFAPRYGSVTPGMRGGIVTGETRLKFVLQPESRPRGRSIAGPSLCDAMKTAPLSG